MEQETRVMIEELSNAFGASGFEEDVIRIARKYTRQLTRGQFSDSMNNLYLDREENRDGRPVVMLDAHSDEVGFMIQAIRDNGTMDFLPLGSWSPATVPAHKVKIRTRSGKLVTGIVASKPVHFQTPEEKAQLPSLDKMVIDVGATSKQEVVEIFGIHVGDPVVPSVETEYNEEAGLMIGKAFDCRIGCAVVIEALRRLKDQELAVNVVGVLSSQEELGDRGSRASVTELNPDIALIIEGAPADDTFTPEYKIQTGLHRGPMIRHMDSSMIANPRLVRLILDTAEKNGIAVQESVRKGGGTDGGVIHNSMGAIPCVVISVPVRYAHSSWCITAEDDFEHTVELVCRVLEALNPKNIEVL